MSAASSSLGPSARELRARKRERARRDPNAIDLIEMPPDILVHILVMLPAIEDLCIADRVCRLFARGTPSFGNHSLVHVTTGRSKNICHCWPGSCWVYV